jgi:hypothetical protein
MKISVGTLNAILLAQHNEVVALENVLGKKAQKNFMEIKNNEKK